jgi:hypothetical protein
MISAGLHRFANALSSRLSLGKPASVPEARVLRLLERRPMTVKEIALRTGASRQELYEILGRLYDQRTVLTAPTGHFWAAGPRVH